MEQLLVERQDIIEENLKNQKSIKIGRGQKNINFPELVLELQRTQREGIDFNVPTELVTAVHHKKLHSDQLLIKLNHANGRGTQYYPMTDWAHRQLAEKCGIPQKYYQTLNTPEHLDLLADNVNEWVRGKDTRMFRTVGGVIRAIVSDRFLRLDNWDVAEAFVEGIVKHGLNPDTDIQACSVTDTHMHLRATIPHLTEEIRKGDAVVQGLMITNSEVGASSFKCEPFFLRLVCQNGLISPRALTRVHLGTKSGHGEFTFSDKVEDMEKNLIIEQVREMIEKTFDQAEFEKWLGELKGTTEVQVPSITEAVNSLASKYNLKQHSDSILDKYAAQADPTQYGLVNALTDWAKDIPTFEGQIEIERIAGEISVMPEQRFRKEIAIEV